MKPHQNKVNEMRLKADFDYLKQKSYDVKKEIDRGSYGVVYKAQDKNTGGIVAIKINFNIISREQLYIQMGLLKLMRCKQKLPFLHRIIENNGTYSIVMDYYKSKSFITFFNKYTILQVKHYLFELLQGLKQLKELGIYHRDIKPSNFLYDDETKKGVIVDFGLAELDSKFVNELKNTVNQLYQNSDEQYEVEKEKLSIYQNIQGCLKSIGHNKIGTQIFMPPESILKIQKQTYSSDIWPVGIIFLQFAARRYNIFSSLPKLQEFINLKKNGFYVCYLLQLASLFGKKNVIEVCRRVFEYELILPQILREVNLRDICITQSFNDVAFDLLTRLLCLDPNQRISVEDALSHDFFEEVRGSQN